MEKTDSENSWNKEYLFEDKVRKKNAIALFVSYKRRPGQGIPKKIRT